MIFLEIRQDSCGKSPCLTKKSAPIRHSANFQTRPSYERIGKAVRMSVNTVRKYVDDLREKQLITTEPTQVTTKNGRKRNGNLLYTIRPIEEAVRYHFEKQLHKAEEEQARLRRIAALEKYDRKHPKTAV